MQETLSHEAKNTTYRAIEIHDKGGSQTQSEGNPCYDGGS